jgi:hypothetical protein
MVVVLGVVFTLCESVHLGERVSSTHSMHNALWVSPHLS